MNSPAPYIDFHTHSEWNGSDVIEVVSIDGNKVKYAKYYTIGFHPWWVNGIMNEDQIKILEGKYVNDIHCLGIGECGLDKLKGLDLDMQEDVFVKQLECANRLNAPVIVHAVRAFDRVIRLRNLMGKTPWAVHGFVRNKVLAGQLLDSGFNISVAPGQNMADSFIEAIKYIPIDRIFIETDSDFRLGVKERYHIFSNIKRTPMETIKEQLFINFKNFYSQKWKYLNG